MNLQPLTSNSEPLTRESTASAPFFSIIVPVYNVAPYLSECLDSVLAQTYPNWECLCVNDGSTDESGAILDEYAQKDARFRIFHQPNAGVSVARNLALDNICGKYFGFLDPDDILDCKYIEHLISLVDGQDDIVGAIGWKTFYDGSFEEKEICLPKAETGLHASSDISAMFETGGLWNKIYPTQILKRNSHLRFIRHLRLGEDMEWLVQFLMLTKGVIVDCSYQGYYYRLRQKSLCHGRSALECALCYWDDTVALASSPITKERPYLLLEWLARCTTSHIYPIRTLADMRVIVQAVERDGTQIWRTALTWPQDDWFKHWKNHHHIIARAYARVFLSPFSINVKAWLLYFVTWYYRVYFKMGRLFKRVFNRIHK